MTESYLSKIKYHNILVIILSIIYFLLGTYILVNIDFDFLSEDMTIGICWFFMLLLFLVIVACFDKYSQPYLCIYNKWLILIPWIYFIGYVGAIAILSFANYVVLSIVFFFISMLGAVVLYCFFYHNKRAMTEEDIRNIIRSQLLNVDDEDVEFLKKRRKFYKWNSLFSIAMIIVIGENIIQYKWIYMAFLLVMFIYNVVSNLKIYSIKYKSLKRIIGHLAIDSLISISLLTLSVLLNLGIISLGKFNISELDIAMLSCFGLIPFAKQNSYAYFAVEHYKLREDLNKI